MLGRPYTAYIRRPLPVAQTKSYTLWWRWYIECYNRRWYTPASIVAFNHSSTVQYDTTIRRMRWWLRAATLHSKLRPNRCRQSMVTI